jgi:hypothetical protein
MDLKSFRDMVNAISTEHDEKEIVIGNAFVIHPEEGEEDKSPKLAIEHRPISCIVFGFQNEILEIHSFDSINVVGKYLDENNRNKPTKEVP